MEAANSWWSNYGRLGRYTNRKIIHQLTALNLATIMLVTGILAYGDRWSRTSPPFR